MTYPVMKITGQKRLSSLLKREFDPQFCREAYTLKAGNGSKRTIVIGALLSVALAAGSTSAAATAGSDNTGDGTLALDNPDFTNSVREGDYIATCTTPGPDGTSKFRIESPEGKTVGTATGGTAFTGHVKFTISGGVTDFVEGDVFTIAVTVDQGSADNRALEWDTSQEVDSIWGVAINDIEAEDGADASGGVALTDGPAILTKSEIIWPDGITDEMKDDVLSFLKSKGIKAR